MKNYKNENLYYICIIYVLYMYYVCILYVYYMYIICILYVLYMCYICIIYVLYIYIYTRRKDGAKAPSLLDHLGHFDTKAWILEPGTWNLDFGA